MNDDTIGTIVGSIVFVIALGLILGLIALGMWGCPQYNVWQQELAGKAALMRAGQERQILVEQAQAEVDSATLRAEAIKIVGQAAKDFPEYRLQEFLGAFAEALQSDSINKIIFVPTERNIPIVEAIKDRDLED
jgi:hypothetical protein